MVQTSSVPGWDRGIARGGVVVVGRRELPSSLKNQTGSSARSMLKRIVSLIGGLAIVATSFIGTTWLLDKYWGPPCPEGRAFVVKPPFTKREGFSYIGIAAVPGDYDENSAPRRSKYALCEDGRLLGPAHSDHAAIGKIGVGRFSHWVGTLIFSTSDNSDPNTNGRTYWLVE